VARHYVLPDTQLRAGVPADHIDWIAADIVRRKPDAIIVLGDWWDFVSLNTHAAPGSASTENQRIEKDLTAGNLAFARLAAPIQAEIDRLAAGHRKRWNPRRIFMFGNHENRLARAVERDPKWSGIIGDHLMLTPGFERHGFNERVWLDGIVYSHFFQSSHSHHAIGGTIDNRLNKIGASFVQGHEQGFRYGTRIQASGATWHGLVAGSCYVHREEYRGNQGQKHWRGCVVLNEVKDGDYCVMPLTLDYYARKATGQSLHDYMAAKYPKEDWAHLQ
jgi:hypothetical protein